MRHGMETLKKLRIISTNVRGLRQLKKRSDFWLKYKELKADIICLQETNLVEAAIHDLKLEWNIEYLLGGNSTNSRGVAILINNTFEYDILDTIIDDEGRFIVTKLNLIGLCTVTIANTYAPNLDDPDWFDTLFKKIEEVDMEKVIVVGDWNVALQTKDLYNYQNQLVKKSATFINKYIDQNNWVDIWRMQHPNDKRFTWGTKKTFKRSRLDYFVVSDDLLALNPKSDILSAYKSDHNNIELTINISNHPRGKSSWKLNNELLKDIELTNLIREEILLAKKTYALPIYSEDYIKNEDEHLDLMINNNLFLDTLLCQIRGIIITHSKRRANNFRKEEKDLEKKILDTEIKLDNGENIILNKDKLDELNNLLIDHRENKLKGHQIRSRSNLIKDWEKPSKYFLNLEKKNI